MILIKRYKIRSYEMGMYFRDREFKGVLGPGRHWILDPLFKVRVEVVSQRQPWLVHDKIATASELKKVLGEKGLAERVVNLL